MCPANSSPSARIHIQLAALPRITRVDERYQSYNVEMAEVIGGNFWRPYAAQHAAPRTAVPASGASGAVLRVGQDPAIFEARPPIDLSNARLRTLATALGPAYIRVSGTWANTVYFPDADQEPSSPPAGFKGVLTQGQWAGVVDFSHAVDARLVTSFAISQGVRDAGGAWTSDQARRFVDYTRSIGSDIAAAELFNEPSAATMGGAPPGYDAAAFARDLAVFRAFAREAVPTISIAGPGSVGEGVLDMPDLLQLSTADLLAAEPRPVFDVFSYHFYGAVSQRCAGLFPGAATTADAALSEEWLARTERGHAVYARLRDRFVPGAPMWLTETADAACGGNPWASTFLDTFRYLDQLGRLAKLGVKAIFHNTLASSEYGLLDQKTFMPRPNYWAALLWRTLMGPNVLDAGPPRPGLHLYAHDLRDRPGGVALLAINTSRTEAEVLDLPVAVERYTLSARKLDDAEVQLNGHVLQLGPHHELPSLSGETMPAGRVELEPASITFLAAADLGK
jgi:heparanase